MFGFHSDIALLEGRTNLPVKGREKRIQAYKKRADDNESVLSVPCSSS